MQQAITPLKLAIGLPYTPVRDQVVLTIGCK